MNREEIIGMAREAGMNYWNTPELAKFAALVAAKERQRLASDVELPESLPAMKWHHNMYTADQLRDYGDRRAAAEQEAVTTLLQDYPHWLGNTAKKEISDAIRARTTP